MARKSPNSPCMCSECHDQRLAVERMKKLKLELPKPEYDWEDLERQHEEYKLRVGKS